VNNEMWFCICVFITNINRTLTNFSSSDGPRSISTRPYFKLQAAVVLSGASNILSMETCISEF
jgi:hypothetical protein